MIEDPTLLGLLSELSEGDGDDTIGDVTHALDKMDALTDPLLASLLCSKEGIAKLKDRIVVEDPDLRCILISRLGKSIVRTWITVCSESFDIEGYVRVENRSEARRMVEDFLDAATDILKSFAQGALGRAPAAVASQTLPDNVACVSAYCEVLTYLCDCYNAAFEPLDSWTDALIGVSGSGSQNIHTAAGIALRSSALSLLPLLKAACSVAFKDRYQLINRCRQLPSYAFAPLRFVSSFMRTLLLDVSPTASLLTVLDSSDMESGSGQSIFGSGDASEASLSGHLPVPVVEYVSSWVNTFLLNILTRANSSAGCVVEEVSSVLRDVICLTQHSALSALRTQVCDVVLQKLFYLIENYTTLIATSTSHTAPHPYTLIAWALLMLRYITPTSTTNTTSHASNATNTGTDAVSYPYYTRVFKLVCDISDPIAQTRFFSEYSTLLLHHTIHHDSCLLTSIDEWDKHSASRSGYKYTTLLPSVLLRGNLVRLLLDTNVRSAGSAVLARFITTLCTAYTTLLQYTLTPLFVLAPVVLEAETKHKSDNKPKAELDVFSFTPTVDTFTPTFDTVNSNTASGNNSVSVEYVALLTSYLEGSGESHPWDMVQHTLCTTTIRSVCSTIHTLLHPVPDSVVSVYTTPDGSAVLERVKSEYNKLVKVLVKLIEGSVFALKTFESCLKWPLGDENSTAHTLYKASSAQHSYTALVVLVSKLLHTSDYALFGASGGSVYTSGTSSTSSNRNNSTTLLHCLSPYTTPYTDTITKLRTELVYTLHLTLEWVNTDFNKVQRAPFVCTFLHTMIVHRVVLATNTSNTSTSGGMVSPSGASSGDILGSGELILKHLRAMLYHNNMHDEYLLTLQAKSMQGTLGGAQWQRFDGPGGGLSTQLQALELLVLFVRQLSGGSNNSSQLQQAVTLLRTVERDYLWSEALELVYATSTGSGYNGSASGTSASYSEDAMHKPTFTTPSGVVVHKLPVSPVLRQQIQVSIECVLPLLYANSTSTSTNTTTNNTTTLPKWADKLYTLSDILAYITTSTSSSGYNILALNNIAPFADYKHNTTTTASTLLDGSAKHKRAHTATNTSSTNTATNTTGTTVCDSVLALLEHYRVSGGDFLFDTTDHILARGLFTSPSPATTSSTTTSATPPAFAYVCSADVVAQVHDVLYAHLYSTNSGTDGSTSSMLRSNLEVFLPTNTTNTDSTTTTANTADLSPEALHTYLNSALLPPRDKHYTVVSGSADLLTILACSTIDIHSSTAYIHVRVFNSAGFKIPTFAVHLIVNGNLLCVNTEHCILDPITSSVSSNTKFSPATTAILQQNSTTTGTTNTTYTTPSTSVVFESTSVRTANGVDFFLPDAYIERTFSCKVVAFAPFQATIRVVYADLVYDEDDIYEIPDSTIINTSNTATRSGRTNSVSRSVLNGTAGNSSTSGGSANNKASAISANAKAKKNATAAANASTRGARYMDEYKTQGNTTKWTAVLDSAPLHVPITALLLPYGYGTLTAMQYWARGSGGGRGSGGVRDTERGAPGIAHAVFSAQWNRLGGRCEVSVPVDGDLVLLSGGGGAGKDAAYLSAQVSTQLRSAVRRAVTTHGGTGMHLLGMDCMVQCGSSGGNGVLGYEHGLDKYTTGGVHGEEDLVFAPYVAWALQTPQGAEISVMLTIDTPTLHGATNSTASTGGMSGVSSIRDVISGLSGLTGLGGSADTPASGSSGVVGSDGSVVYAWNGRLTARCSDSHTLQAVVSDMEYLVYALSGGYMGLSEHNNL